MTAYSSIGKDRIDPVSLGLSHMIKLARLVEKCREHINRNWTGKEEEKPKISGEAISRKAREIPTLMSSAGLVPSLTFYMSKAGESENIYRNVYKYLAGEGEDQVLLNNLPGICLLGSGERVRPGILVSEMEKEKGGYAIILASVAAAMKELGLIGNHDPSTLRGLAKILLELHRDAVREMMAEQLVLEYLEEAKKLAEAFFGSKE